MPKFVNTTLDIANPAHPWQHMKDNFHAIFRSNKSIRQETQ